MFCKSSILTVYSATSSLLTSLMTSVWLVPMSCISYLSLGTILLVPLYHVTGTFSLFSSQVKWHSVFSSTCCSDSVAVNSTGTSEIKRKANVKNTENIYLVEHSYTSRHHHVNSYFDAISLCLILVDLWQYISVTARMICCIVDTPTFYNEVGCGRLVSNPNTDLTRLLWTDILQD